MSNTREVIVETRQLGVILKALSCIGGKKSVALSYALGRTLLDVQKEQVAFVSQLQQYIDSDKDGTQALTDEQQQELQEIISSSVTLTVPEIALGDILNAGDGIVISNDTALPYLVDVGILKMD